MVLNKYAWESKRETILRLTTTKGIKLQIEKIKTNSSVTKKVFLKWNFKNINLDGP